MAGSRGGSCLPVRSRKYLGRLAAVATLSIFVSACALPPMVAAVSVGADIFSLSETGKTVGDHGISFVMRQDCAMLRVFYGKVCTDYAPDEDTPEGALVALAALSDPALNPAVADPMAVPHNLAYLDDALGLAVASAPVPDREHPAVAFASIRDHPRAGGNLAYRDGFIYLAAGING